MLRPRAGGRGGGEVGDLAGSSRRRPRSRLQHVSLRLGPPPYTWGSLATRPGTRQKLRSLLSVLSPRSSWLPPARGSRLPAPQPPAPARARAPACAAAAAGREGEGGEKSGGRCSHWPRLGRRSGRQPVHGGGVFRMLPSSHALGRGGCSAGAQIAVSLALCGALASLQREGREESGAGRWRK